MAKLNNYIDWCIDNCEGYGLLTSENEEIMGHKIPVDVKLEHFDTEPIRQERERKRLARIEKARQDAIEREKQEKEKQELVIKINAIYKAQGIPNRINHSWYGLDYLRDKYSQAKADYLDGKSILDEMYDTLKVSGVMEEAHLSPASSYRNEQFPPIHKYRLEVGRLSNLLNEQTELQEVEQESKVKRTPADPIFPEIHTPIFDVTGREGGVYEFVVAKARHDPNERLGINGYRLLVYGVRQWWPYELFTKHWERAE